MSEVKTNPTGLEPSVVVAEAHNIGKENLTKAFLADSELIYPLL